LIGEPNRPVRAITFAGGVFDTAMQLGVVHALLVARARPPDIVVGISAGAVNSVALAEVLQAGDALQDHPDWRGLPEAQLAAAQTAARIARFRQILDASRRAPGELLDALLPDPYQVDAQRPLEPLQLPIQKERERRGRLEALMSRAGMINFYNQLLDVRTSIGALTRVVRVVLGLRAAGEARPPVGRRVAAAAQLFMGWLLLGANLGRLAPLVSPLLATLLHPAPREERGAAAGELIFRWPGIRRLPKLLAHVLALLSLALAWLGASALVLLAPAAAAHLLTWLPIEWVRRHGALVAAGLYAGIAIALAFVAVPWRHLGSAVRRGVPHALQFLVLVTAWGAGLALAAFSVQLLVERFDLASVVASWGALRGEWFTAYLATLVVLVAIAAVGTFLWRHSPKPFWARLLERYALDNSLFSAHPLRQLFIELFDPDYYGGIEMDSVVERALSTNPTPVSEDINGKLLRRYTAPRVGLAVADVSSGTLRVLDPDVRVVNGLLAATAMVPLFPPVPVGETLCVDGSNIANEPTRALMDFLRGRLNPNSTVVHVYPVASLPVSRPQLYATPLGHLTGLVDVVGRALHLQRFRDATLERRLTELYTKGIPGGRVLFPTPGSAPDAPKRYIRAWVHPIEPDAPITLNRDLLAAQSNEERRTLVAETVAEGCRAALQVMMQPAIRQAFDQAGATTSSGAEAGLGGPLVPCRRAVEQHLGPGEAGLPGSVAEGGPGLVEVCRHCAIWEADAGGRRRRAAAALRVPVQGPVHPRWPSAAASDVSAEPAGESEYDRERRKPRGETPNFQRVAGWPGQRNDVPGDRRPLVNLLFSGGVFRGVYQMGVLNALSEVHLQPDVIAGASVGSITAAMVARALSLPRGVERERRIASLAATYLALDRLILTDRFADFIRNLTLRAASTDFSLRQADRVFRRYDVPRSGQFDRELRLVVAGLERLFYISPFELRTLVEAIRDRQSHKVFALLRGHLQEWLRRGGVENEILGAEPLALLITQHVIEGLSSHAGLDPAQVPFDLFLHPNGICFLATATNLSQGKLEILGSDQLQAGRAALTLLNGLLASSAFPGVFRPREAPELTPDTPSEDQFIDGGVIDNLPLDAVAEFLQEAAVNHVIAPRPLLNDDPTCPVPHLLFSASLETRLTRPTPEQLTALQSNWPALFRRTRQLIYNKKLEIYAATQRDLRDIFNLAQDAKTRAPWTPLDLEVVMVRPQWLCGTFAFHPMLGFRRSKQAASIAHGCASTLVRLGELQQSDTTRRWAAAWGIDREQLPPVERSAAGSLLTPSGSGDGRCWFRPNVDCPFSPRRLRTLALPEGTTRGLTRIYELCGRPETHQP